MFRNILVAFDGSPPADEALTQAIDLASCAHGSLTLLAGAPDLPESAYPPWTDPSAPLIEDPVGRAEALLQRARERVPAHVPVTAIVATEPIRDALMRQIEAGHHDLLVIGSHGWSGLRSAVLGSVSDHAVRHSPVPVLVIHATSDGRRAPATGAAVSGA